ncbi:MAG: protein-tyrosine phosphatase family protein [Nocardioidaceae bacterium]
MSAWTDESGVVVLPDGRRVRGTGQRTARGEVPAPDFAVYLLGRDPEVKGWPYRRVRWRDFRLPDSPEDAVEALTEAYDRARDQRVEIACAGGIGRTGTALALLATMSGVPPEDAVTWVRTHYHPRAVETRAQRRWVERTAASLRR